MEAKRIPQLSPATRQGLFTHLVENVPPQKGKVERVKLYLCPECDSPHDTPGEAASCCPNAIDWNYFYVCPHCDKEHREEDDAIQCCATNENPTACPVCGADAAGDAHEAANCCLWKDLPPDARLRIACAVEYRGATWAEAIAAEAGGAA